MKNFVAMTVATTLAAANFEAAVEQGFRARGK